MICTEYIAVACGHALGGAGFSFCDDGLRFSLARALFNGWVIMHESVGGIQP